MQPHPLRLIKNMNRGREIAAVLINHGFGDVLERLGLRPYLNWGRKLVSRKNREIPPELTTACRIRLALEELGPTFVKFGQVLSTRPDIIPRDVIQELSQLQEHVPPFPIERALAQIEKEFSRPASALYGKFHEEPLAAGSLAQVHRATSHDGRELAVKIRRPDVVHSVNRDLGLMIELAQLLERHVPESQVFDPVGLVNHFTRTIRREMSFRREARTMIEFSRMFEDDSRLYVPRVELDLTSDAILTMEFIDGFKTDNPEALRKVGLDPRTVARDGAGLFLRQAFEMGIFHGDPHPGNMRIRADGSIALLDYGMVGFLEESKRERLVDLVLAVSRNDVDRAVEVVLDIGQPTQPVDRVLVHADVRDFLDAYYGIPLHQLQVGPMLNDFVSILGSHGLRCPGDLMVLIRAIVTLEGVGRQLDPQFNLAGVLAPFIEKVIKARYDPRRVAERTVEDMKTLLRAAHDLPLHLTRTLHKASQGELNVQLEHRGLDRLITEFDRSSNRVVVGVVVSALILATALIIRSAATATLWVVVPTFILSGLLGLWLVWGILRSGRL